MEFRLTKQTATGAEYAAVDEHGVTVGRVMFKTEPTGSASVRLTYDITSTDGQSPSPDVIIGAVRNVPKGVSRMENGSWREGKP